MSTKIVDALRHLGCASTAAGTGEPFSFRILHEFPNSLEERAWRAFLDRVQEPSHYVAPEYFLEPYWARSHPFAVLAIEGSKIAGVLTGIHEGNDTVSGNCCRPQTCFDLATDHSQAFGALARGLLAEAGSAELATIFAWAPMEDLRRLGFRIRPLEGAIVLDLRQGLEALFKQLHKSRRTNIRYAIKHGVEVFEASSEEDVASYYTVYRRWRQNSRKKGPVWRHRFPVFAEAYRLRDNRRLFLARHAGQIIAGVTVRFSRGGLLENQESSSLDEQLHLHPNDLLIWKTIEWGYAQGFARYSLGGSHTFFRRTGGTLIPVYRHRLDRTWLRRHDLREALEGHDATRAMLPPLRSLLRGGRALRATMSRRLFGFGSHER
jgi:hypothetical protein